MINIILSWLILRLWSVAFIDLIEGYQFHDGYNQQMMPCYEIP